MDILDKIDSHLDEGEDSRPETKGQVNVDKRLLRWLLEFAIQRTAQRDFQYLRDLYRKLFSKEKWGDNYTPGK